MLIVLDHPLLVGCSLSTFSLLHKLDGLTLQAHLGFVVTPFSRYFPTLITICHIFLPPAFQQIALPLIHLATQSDLMKDDTDLRVEKSDHLGYLPLLENLSSRLSLRPSTLFSPSWLPLSLMSLITGWCLHSPCQNSFLRPSRQISLENIQKGSCSSHFCPYEVQSLPLGSRKG